MLNSQFSPLAARSAFLRTCLFIALTCRITDAAPPAPQYRIGATATAEIVSPVHLIVIDHVRTEKLRREEAQRAPAIFRFYPDTIAEAEARFRAAFAAGREEFTDVLDGDYARRILDQ